MRLWGRGPGPEACPLPSPGPQAPRTVAEYTCLLLAEAVEGHLRDTPRPAHTSSAVPGTEGGERGWQAAGNLWGHSAGVGAGAPVPTGPPGLPLQGWALGSSASPRAHSGPASQSEAHTLTRWSPLAARSPCSSAPKSPHWGNKGWWVPPGPVLHPRPARTPAWVGPAPGRVNHVTSFLVL